MSGPASGADGPSLALAHRGALVDYVKRFQPDLWAVAEPAGLADLCAGRQPAAEFLRRFEAAVAGSKERDALRRGAQRILTLLERLPKDPSSRGARPLEPGDRVGSYTVLAELGRGGMGVVFACRDERLGREVALKQISSVLVNPRTRERFKEEATAVARLRHPGIVSVLDVGEHEGSPYVVMELVRGESLRARLERDGPLPVREAAEVVRQVALALQHAHERRVLHRDVKPDNVLLDPEGAPILIDFGVAKLLDNETQTALTRTGQLLGTPAYMAPEQTHRKGRTPDARADVYSLGATLHALLTGEPPFDEETLVALLAAVASRAPAPPSSLRPDVPPALDRIVRGCLAKDPDHRYPSAQALADDLERFLSGQPVTGVKGEERASGLPARALGLAGLALTIALGSFVAGHRRGRDGALEAQRAERERAAAEARATLAVLGSASTSGLASDAALRALRAAARWQALDPSPEADAAVEAALRAAR